MKSYANKCKRFSSCKENHNNTIPRLSCKQSSNTVRKIKRCIRPTIKRRAKRHCRGGDGYKHMLIFQTLCRMNILQTNCMEMKQKLSAVQLIQLMKILLHDININNQHVDRTALDYRVAVCQMQDGAGKHRRKVYYNCLQQMVYTVQNENGFTPAQKALMHKTTMGPIVLQWKKQQTPPTVESSAKQQTPPTVESSAKQQTVWYTDDDTQQSLNSKNISTSFYRFLCDNFSENVDTTTNSKKIIIDKRVLSQDWIDLFNEYYSTPNPTLPDASSIDCLPIFYVILGHANHWQLLVHYQNKTHIIDSTTQIRSHFRSVCNMSSIPTDVYHFTGNQSDNWSCGYHCLDMLMTFLQVEIECATLEKEIDIQKTITNCTYPKNDPAHLKIIEKVLLKWGEIATNDAKDHATPTDDSDDVFESIKSPRQLQISASLLTKIESCNMNAWNQYCSIKFSENMYVRIADITMTEKALSDFQKETQKPDFVEHDSATKIQRVHRARISATKEHTKIQTRKSKHEIPIKGRQRHTHKNPNTKFQ